MKIISWSNFWSDIDLIQNHQWGHQSSTPKLQVKSTTKTYLKKQVCSNFYRLMAVGVVQCRFAIDRTWRILQKLPNQPKWRQRYQSSGLLYERRPLKISKFVVKVSGNFSISLTHAFPQSWIFRNSFKFPEKSSNRFERRFAHTFLGIGR